MPSAAIAPGPDLPGHGGRRVLSTILNHFESDVKDNQAYIYTFFVYIKS